MQCNMCGGKTGELGICLQCFKSDTNSPRIEETSNPHSLAALPYQAHNAVVTPTIATLNGVNYPINSISSYRIVEQKSKLPEAILLIVVGLLFVVLGGVFLNNPNPWNNDNQVFGTMMLVPGLVMVGVGLVFSGRRSSFRLLLGLSGGERHAFEDRDFSAVNAVAEALGTAVSAARR